MKKLLGLITTFAISIILFGCSNNIKPDLSEKEAEKALNEGENIDGKTVSLKVSKFVPNGTLGYTIQAGDHLNFISPDNPEVKNGDELIVKITETKNVLGSFVLNYELLNKTPSKTKKENETSSKEQTSTTEIDKKEIELIKTNKIGFDANTLKNKGLDDFAGRNYKISNEYTDLLNKNSFKIEIFESYPIEFALFTKKDEKMPSAIMAYSSIKLANSTVEEDYKKIEETIESLISDNAKDYVEKDSQIIEEQNYTTYIFNNEISKKEVLKPITDIMHDKNQKLEKEINEDRKKRQEEADELSKLPLEHQNALSKAEKYIKSSSFSKEKLYKQLLFEKFPDDSARYAVENIEVDWNEEALDKAKSYQKSSSMSLERLKSQLTSENGEQFTEEQAEYAINNLNK